MTRQEEDWVAGRCCDAKAEEGIILISHIIKIVDDFNATRICENCNFFDLFSKVIHTADCQGVCTNIKSKMYRSQTTLIFGCNHFERKES